MLAAHWASQQNKQLYLWYLHHYAKPIEPERAAVFAAATQKFSTAKLLQEQADVSQVATRLGYSWEHAASIIRRKRLNRLVMGLGNTASVITGHTYSDYLETLELRRLRKIPSSGFPGLSDRDLISGFYRPLYQMTREAVRSECLKLGLVYFDDPSNNDLNVQRNHVRKTIDMAVAPSLPQSDRPEVPPVGREYSIARSTFEARSPAAQAREVYTAFRRLAVVRKFTRNDFMRACRLPFARPPFFAHAEGDRVVFRRGLGNSVSLPVPEFLPFLRGNQVTRSLKLQKKFGRKSVAKIFSEKKLSPRDRRRTLVYLDSHGTVETIEFPQGIL